MVERISVVVDDEPHWGVFEGLGDDQSSLGVESENAIFLSDARVGHVDGVFEGGTVGRSDVSGDDGAVDDVASGHRRPISSGVLTLEDVSRGVGNGVPRRVEYARRSNVRSGVSDVELDRVDDRFGDASLGEFSTGRDDLDGVIEIRGNEGGLIRGFGDFDVAVWGDVIPCEIGGSALGDLDGDSGVGSEVIRRVKSDGRVFEGEGVQHGSLGVVCGDAVVARRAGFDV